MAKRQESSLSKQEIKKLATLLEEQIKREKQDKTYASVKEILTILAKGSILAFSLIAPNTLQLFASFKKDYDPNFWKKYNFAYLKRTIKRLEKQKLIKIEQKDNTQIVKIAQAGRQKILKYTLETLKIKPPKVWDGKWRIVIYDIPDKKQYLRALIRGNLKNLGFLAIQESVYLIPFPCEEQIEFLRSFYNLGEHIKMIRADKIENERVYKEYFGV